MLLGGAAGWNADDDSGRRGGGGVWWALPSSTVGALQRRLDDSLAAFDVQRARGDSLARKHVGGAEGALRVWMPARVAHSAADVRAAAADAARAEAEGMAAAAARARGRPVLLHAPSQSAPLAAGDRLDDPRIVCSHGVVTLYVYMRAV